MKRPASPRLRRARPVSMPARPSPRLRPARSRLRPIKLRPPGDLNPLERRIAALLLSLKGPAAAMTGAEVAAAFGVHVRLVGKVARALRLRGLPAVGGCGVWKGYWVARTGAEYRAFCEAEARRARSIYKARRAGLKSAWLAWADGQKRLRRRG